MVVPPTDTDTTDMDETGTDQMDAGRMGQGCERRSGAGGRTES